jgi:hypothetical protein
VSNLFLTLVIAFVIIVIAIACLAIGWLITGKTRIERGACGRNPTTKKDESCDITKSCDLCAPPQSTKRNTLHEDLDKDEEKTNV